ncbi:MAG: cell division protein ZapA [Bacteroidetes bacterium]|nr:cell division protein ZapA [Bacteroidota bacterium]
MSDLIALNITIADRTFRIKAKPEDEEKIRKTLKLINDKIVEFKVEFAGRDMQDYISMVILWYATRAAAENTTDQSQLIEALQNLENQLDRI